MKLHFPWAEVEKLLAEVTAAATAKPLYGEHTGKGLWLVGDQGVYLMANTADGPLAKARKESERAFVVYADECNPHKLPFDDWWEAKQRSFGADDGVEFLSLQSVEDGRKHAPSHLVITMTATKLAISVKTPKPQAKTKG